ncbi:two-partner secretion domain-containing protein [Vacuolonema iberomarrocanum]|uniref:two-partner secretion domain-containing protein n=1 Tax=Vacuolonema iberomarrocanum TaxID=3454632 RepID=UPI0019E7D397|nr:filamentous hemagglutinin N-terminal domain-containing protein [filamentous cyanobacterium LEGE 07170]
MSTSHGNFFPFTLAASSLLGLMMALPATAQLPLEADDTLGGELSLVVPIGGFPGFFVIEGGAARGGNLFHSFEEFNVNENGGVVFADPAAIDNVIARVTGDNPSNILGALGMFNDANLFLLNPNGIFFGENAQLVMEGSFLASTADSLIFPDDLDFSAANPDSNALLSINVPIGLQFGNQPAPITNEAFLNLAADRSLVLAGGPVTLDNGSLSPSIPNDTETLSGRVEVAAIGAAGRVDLAVDGSDLALRLPETLPRADIILQNNSFIGAIGNGGGAIALYGDNVSLRDASQLSLGIGRDLGGANNQLGRLRVNATGQVFLSGGSIIQSGIFAGGTGIGGPIRIQATELEVREGSGVITFSNGSGNAGDIDIQASDRLLLNGTNAMGNQRSRITSIILTEGTGTSGTIDIETAVLRIEGGAALSTELLGTGEAGAISIRARDRVRVSGFNEEGNLASSIESFTATNSVGSGGNIDIQTTVLEVQNGARISTTINGRGDGGNLRLWANKRIRFSNSRLDGIDPSNASTAVGRFGNGNAGRLEIRTPVLELLDGSFVFTSTFGRGSAGRIVIRASDRIRLAGNAQSSGTGSLIFSTVGRTAIGNGNNIEITTPILEVQDGGRISADTSGRGDAGNVIIRASDRIRLAGNDQSSGMGSFISSAVGRTAVGNGNNIEITTPILEVQDGAQISASTFGQGNAGNVIIRARARARFTGRSTNGNAPSGTSSNVRSTANGNGGNVRITTSRLEVRDGAQISAGSLGRGNAGDVVLRARDRITLSGTSFEDQRSIAVSSSIQESGVGQGGDVIITTPFLDVSGRAIVSASTAGRGSAGNVFVNADRTLVQGMSDVQSAVVEGARGDGGNVEIRTRILQLRRGGQINTSTGGEGDAGNVIVRAGDRLAISSPQSERPQSPSGIFSRVNARAIGSGGTIDIQAPRVDMEGGFLSALSIGEGIGGNIFVTADRLQLDDRAQIDTQTLSTDGGNIALAIDDLLLLRNNSLISTEAGNAQSGGDGGDITINNADGFIVAVPEENSDIVANAFEGRGGNIRITTQGIFGLEFREERTPLSDITASSEIGVDGDVEIITPNLDPTQGLVALPTDVVDAADQIGQVCPTGSGAADQLGRFVVTGRGGIASSPVEILDEANIELDWLDDDTPQGEPRESVPQSQSQPSSLVEADGWARSADGSLHLVATAPEAEGAIAPSLQPCP